MPVLHEQLLFVLQSGCVRNRLIESYAACVKMAMTIS